MTNCKRVTVWLELLGRSSPTHSRRAARVHGLGGLQGTEYAQNHQSNLHVIDDPRLRRGQIPGTVTQAVGTMCADIVTSVSRSEACAIVEPWGGVQKPHRFVDEGFVANHPVERVLDCARHAVGVLATRDQHSIRRDYPLAERCNRSGIRYLGIGVE